MSHSRQTIALAVWLLTLAVLACQSQPLPATAPVQVAPSPSSTPPVGGTTFPTVTPIVTSTLIPTPGESPTATVTISAPGRVRVATATPSGPAAKLQFTVDDIEYSLSPKRKGDSKVQLTITLRPKGGLPPYSFVLDPGANETKINGLTFTFDWHNCGQGEPHTIVLISADGQRSQPVGFIYPYDC